MLTLVAVLMGVLIGGAVTMLLGGLFRFDLMQVMEEIPFENTLDRRNILRGSNLASHLFAFSASSIAVACFVFRRQWTSRLGLAASPGAKALAASVGFMLFSMPWVQFTYWLNKQAPLPQWMASMEDRTTGIVQSLLVMNSPAELLFTLVVIALAPAIGEELLFRGLVQQQLARLWRRPHLAVWVTAVLFSIIHFQFAGFLPRLLLGAGLGYLFLWTRSLWAPIAGHFAINAVQVLAQYALKMDLENADSQLDFSSLILPCLLVLPVLYGLAVWLRKNRPETPMPVP